MNKEQSLRPILVIGRIGRAHGLHGEVRIQAMTSDPERFYDLADCLLLSPDEKIVKDVHATGARVTPEQVLLKLRGIDSREQAEPLNGWLLAVRREQAVILPEDTWFICDLIGCAVYDEQRGYLGDLADVLQNAAQDVYVVRMAGQPNLMFPALKSILTNVDITGRRMDIRLPAGLYDVYRGEKA